MRLRSTKRAQVDFQVIFQMGLNSRMKHLAFVIVLNAINTAIFWTMWRGFYTSGDSQTFWKLSVFHTLVVIGSFGFYFLRNTRSALHAVRGADLLPSTDRENFARVCFLVGAYGLACTNMVVAAVFWLLNGTIDIWAAGSRV